MQPSMPFNNSSVSENSPFCSFCRRGSGYAALKQCEHCRKHSHRVCRETAPIPTNRFARCPNCTVPYRCTSQSSYESTFRPSNIQTAQPDLPSQMLPQLRQPRQLQPLKVDIPPQYIPTLHSVRPPASPTIPYPFAFTTNPSYPAAQTQIYQQPRLQNRAAQTQALQSQQVAITPVVYDRQVFQPPPPPPPSYLQIKAPDNGIAQSISSTNPYYAEPSRRLCLHPPGMTCNLCIVFRRT